MLTGDGSPDRLRPMCDSGKHRHQTGGVQGHHQAAPRTRESVDEGACAGPGAFRDGGANAFSDRIFEYRQVETRKLVLVLVITSATMLVEIVGGVLTRSLALISDAGHMFTHSFAIVISLGAILIAKNPPCHHRTYGWFRAEIMAAFVNSLFLFGVTAWIVWESFQRLRRPAVVLGLEMFAVALFGLLVNLVTMAILRGHHRGDMNIRGVFLHLLADTLSSVAIVIGGVVIWYTGAAFLDPIISLGISLAILAWAWGLFKESSRILLEMAPRGLDVDSLADELKGRFPEIQGLYNVHFWAITSEMYVFTAHLRVREEALRETTGREVIRKINRYLKERYPIVESTIQWIH